MDALNFDISRKEVEVVLGKGGEKKKYILREFCGLARDKYTKSIFESIEVEGVADDKVKIKNIKTDGLVGSESKLIALCLFTEEDDKPVSEEVIQSYPVTVIDRLYKACQELNGLGAKAEAQAKND